MFKPKQSKRLLALSLVISVLALAMLSPAIFLVKAQGSATVVVLDAVGGTSDPSGTHTYTDGATVTITATPNDNFVFVNWLINDGTNSTISTDNPVSFTAVGGITYAIQPVFNPIQAPPGGALPTNMATAAIVVVVASAGGTTTPGPGTYAFSDATSLMLTATPSSGFKFVHWTIGGTMMSHGPYPFNPNPTDNPYNVNHGYGQTYYYQAVFTPTGVTEPTPVGATPTPAPILAGLTMDTLIIILLVVVIIVILIAFGIYASRKRK